jgi:hypothetical protein
LGFAGYWQIVDGVNRFAKSCHAAGKSVADIVLDGKTGIEVGKTGRGVWRRGVG